MLSSLVTHRSGFRKGGGAYTDPVPQDGKEKTGTSTTSPQGFRFLFHCGLCRLQGLWWEGGHWCQSAPPAPRQKKGGTERLLMGTSLFRMGILPAQFSIRGFYQYTHRGFQHFPRWSLCSHNKGSPESSPDLSHRNSQREGTAPHSRRHPQPPSGPGDV